MVLRRPARVAAAVLIVVTVLHLGAQLAGWEHLADVTQWVLMPLLALTLATQVPAPRGQLVSLTLVALVFSWLGDAAPDLFSGDTAFIVKVAFFLVAQVVYIVAFSRFVRDSVLVRRPLLVLPYAAAIVALVIACAPGADALLVPVLIYGACLGTMAMLATGLGPLTWAGGALFLVSDGLIALDAFVSSFSLPVQGFWVMLTYIAAQVLIVSGAVQRRDVPAPLGREAVA